MQKFLAVLAVVALAEGMPVRDQWTSFKASHGKKYSVKENTLRFNIWNANRKMVEEHNAGDHEWTMAMYEWSDWTQEEFAERMLGYQAPENLESIPRKHFDNAAPSHIDFREEGKVTPVKNQGQCGSCWAFSATGAMEGMWMNSHSTLYSLSEQQMVDCGQGSCNGGYMDSAWQTVRNGANTEADYPYEARDGQCRAKSNSFVATNSGSQRVSHSESSLESAMAQVGYSISVAIHVGSSFQHYSGGIFSDPQCQYGQLNHGVLAVGYDHGSNWIVKNSWGGSWGEGGYIRMKQGENSCGITKDPMYPIV